MNWALMVACVGLVLGFRSSSNLAAAYGVARLRPTMVITTILFYVVARERWRWACPVSPTRWSGSFLVIDLAFFGANIVRSPTAAGSRCWSPAVVFILLTTWKRGRVILSERLDEHVKPLSTFKER